MPCISAYTYQTYPVHTEVITAADDLFDEFDPTVMGPTPNGHQYGYCVRCKQPMRWDVARQQWMDTTVHDIEMEMRLVERLEEVERKVAVHELNKIREDLACN